MRADHRARAYRARPRRDALGVAVASIRVRPRGRASITPSSSSMPSDDTATAAAPRSRSRSPSRALAPLLAALGGGAAVPASPELRECAAAEASRMHSLMPATVYCRRWRWFEAGAMAAVAAVAVAIVAVVVGRHLHEFAAQRLRDVSLVGHFARAPSSLGSCSHGVCARAAPMTCTQTRARRAAAGGSAVARPAWSAPRRVPQRQVGVLVVVVPSARADVGDGRLGTRRKDGRQPPCARRDGEAAKGGVRGSGGQPHGGRRRWAAGGGQQHGGRRAGGRAARHRRRR